MRIEIRDHAGDGGYNAAAEADIIARAIELVKARLAPVPDAARHLDKLELEIKIRDSMSPPEVAEEVSDALYAACWALRSLPAAGAELPSGPAAAAEEPEFASLPEMAKEAVRWEKIKKLTGSGEDDGLIRRGGEAVPEPVRRASETVRGGVEATEKVLEENPILDEVKFTYDREKGVKGVAFEHSIAKFTLPGMEETEAGLKLAVFQVGNTSIERLPDGRFAVTVVREVTGQGEVSAIVKIGGGATRGTSYKTTMYFNDPRLAEACKDKLKFDYDELSRDPLTKLRTGDQLTRKRSITVSVGFETPSLAGTVSGSLGAGVVTTDDNDLTITKSGPAEVTVEVAWKNARVTSAKGELAIKWLKVSGELGWKAFARNSQVYAFDLTKPAAREAYRQLVENGILPSWIYVHVDNADQAQFDKIQEDLGEGVKLSKISAAEGAERSRKYGVDVFKNLIERSQTSGRERSIEVSEDGRTVSQKEYVQTANGNIVRDRLRGAETNLAVAELISEEKEGKTTHKLSVGYLLTDAATTGREVNERFALRAAQLGLPVPREFIDSADLGETKIAALAEISESAPETLAGRKQGDWLDASEMISLDDGSWRKRDAFFELREKILESRVKGESAGKQLEILQTYLLSADVEGLAALRRLAPEQITPQVVMSIDKYASKVAEIEKNSILYDARLEAAAQGGGRSSFSMNRDLALWSRMADELDEVENEVRKNPYLRESDSAMLLDRIAILRNRGFGRAEDPNALPLTEDLGNGLRVSAIVASAHRSDSIERWIEISQNGTFGFESRTADVRSRPFLDLRTTLEQHGPAVTEEHVSAIERFLNNAGPEGLSAIRQAVGLEPAPRFQGGDHGVEREVSARVERAKAAYKNYSETSDRLSPGLLGLRASPRDRMAEQLVALERLIAEKQTDCDPVLVEQWLGWIRAVRHWSPELEPEGPQVPPPAPPVAQPAPVKASLSAEQSAPAPVPVAQVVAQ